MNASRRSRERASAVREYHRRQSQRSGKVREVLGLDDAPSWMIVSEHNVHAWPKIGAGTAATRRVQLPLHRPWSHRSGESGNSFTQREACVRAFGRTARTRNSRRKLSQFASACAAGRRLGRRRLGRGPLVGRGVDRAEARCPHPRIDRSRKSSVSVWLSRGNGP